ncbi:protein of unknown function [Trichlorobacter ammonificans]|uniref:Uncharacterized protein n=1 Tax=Trichlorobacter ammonificans TaxID=2916410 RepID=A0ABN8HHU7_9BACT|nr:protein of unknown function [Trichlorobacter ammonificans]
MILEFQSTPALWDGRFPLDLII